MTELFLDLDFACSGCGEPVGVTLRCKGRGLASDNRVARGRVPCPHCCEINVLVFNAGDGALYSVGREHRARLRMPALCPN